MKARRNDRIFTRAFLFFLFLLSSCSGSTLSYHSPGPYQGGSLLGTGTYLGEAWISPAKGEAVRFNMIFARKPGDTLLSAIAPSGKPYFRVRDSLSVGDEPRFHKFATELSLPQGTIEAFYQGIRPLLILDDKPEIAQPLVRARYPDGRPSELALKSGAILHLNEYDWEGHAFRLSIDNSAWNARVTLREYEISN